MVGTSYALEVCPKIPPRLVRLQELANDLYYSWSAQVRSLFYNLDASLWLECGHNPKLFLRRVSQHRLDKAATDRSFLESFNLVLADYDNYLRVQPQSAIEEWIHPQENLVAYFSMEFGFHESMPIYSGGLGILAGDHCKAASDMGLPLAAVGLLYRKGYFSQYIDAHGAQLAQYSDTQFSHLPIQPAKTPSGGDLYVVVHELPNPVVLRVWEARVGRVRLYLLDSDVDENGNDRSITHQLYGGDAGTRVQQEIVLGVGGVRALRALGLTPDVWHINEGHGAFQIIERCREKTAAGMSFDAALESVAAATVFTTHTPVPAGHDIFSRELLLGHFRKMIDSLGVSTEEFLSLGVSPSAQGGFNMTALALRGSRFHNGVSAIHGKIASKMEAYVWPKIPYMENPIGHVTNGVHVYSFLAPEWRNLFDLEFGHEWRNHLLNAEYWKKINAVSEYSYWSVRQTLKAHLLRSACERVQQQMQRNGSGAVEIERTTRLLDPTNTNVLILGFARRFATYKRATLIFNDLPRLTRLLNTPGKPVLLLFAGKAHPSDMAGQQLISTIHALSKRTEFQGKLVMIENYNLAIARRLVTGVDVWLNTPEYPMEASGTSGQKAGINGVVNLSVLDGWWGEGFNGENGWGIAPHPAQKASERDEVEAGILLDILEYKVIPAYYDRNGHGYSQNWVRLSKASMKSILPQFNAERMVMDYVRDYYSPAIKHGRRLAMQEEKHSKELALWKRKIHAHWHHVSARRLDQPQTTLATGEHITIRVAVRMGELSPQDIKVECLVGQSEPLNPEEIAETLTFEAAGGNSEGEMEFQLSFKPKLSGLQFYKIRLFPFHALLAHKFEVGYMVWV